MIPASHIHHLQCVLCGTTYHPAEVPYACPSCGALGALAVHYDYEQIAPHISRAQLAVDHNHTLWRYRALLPISYSHDAPPLEIGYTPLYPVKSLRDYLAMPNLWLKDDTRNPSASLKDRASIIAVMLAEGRTVACASTGNAASSLAVQSAAVGLPCYIFVPQNAPRAKIVQLLMCGATVFSVDGSYDDAFDLCIEACNAFGWYNRNTGYNPYLVEGKKTVGLEIAEQLGWHVPDTVLVPTGDGCIISGGYGITVTDAEILTAEKELAMYTGVFAEPSGAAAYAGLLRLLADGNIAKDERVVLLITGSGLKNIDAVVNSAGSVIPIARGSEGMSMVTKLIP